MTSSPFYHITDELLSAYLDNAVSEQERIQVETAIGAEPDIAWRLDSLRQTVQLLNRLPERALPRSFVLRPEQIGDVKTAPTSAAQEEAAGFWASLSAGWRSIWHAGNPVLRNAMAASMALLLIVLVGGTVALPGPSTDGAFEAASAPMESAAQPAEAVALAPAAEAPVAQSGANARILTEVDRSQSGAEASAAKAAPAADAPQADAPQADAPQADAPLAEAPPAEAAALAAPIVADEAADAPLPALVEETALFAAPAEEASPAAVAAAAAPDAATGAAEDAEEMLMAQSAAFITAEVSAEPAPAIAESTAEEPAAAPAEPAAAPAAASAAAAAGAAVAPETASADLTAASAAAVAPGAESPLPHATPEAVALVPSATPLPAATVAPAPVAAVAPAEPAPVTPAQTPVTGLPPLQIVQLGLGLLTIVLGALWWRSRRDPQS
jgi:hypothetical protein